MNRESWSAAVAFEATKLVALGDIPRPLALHPAFHAMAVLPLLERATITIRLTSDSVKPQLSVAEFRNPRGLVSSFLRWLKGVTQGHAFGTQRQLPAASTWLDSNGFDDFIVATLKAGLEETSRSALLQNLRQHVQRVPKLVKTPSEQYLASILARDLGGIPFPIAEQPPQRLYWLLAVDHDGSRQRAAIVMRRYQAFTTYAALADDLRKTDLTQAIDDARPLAPVLRSVTGYSKQLVHALAGACPPDRAPYHSPWRGAIAELQNHEVPVHEWAAGGAPNAPEAWINYVSVRRSGTLSNLIRTDYHGSTPEQVKDAVEGFRTDLLLPAIKAYVVDSKLTADAAGRLRTEAERRRHDETLLNSFQKEFLRLVRTVLIGSRRPKAFQQGAALWHRRAATVAALRNERQAEKRGWPALCPSWSSACGRFTINPLTSASALVEEGRAHQHCVGGYYEQCRLGETQILSLREATQPIATVEILLGGDFRFPKLTVNQFKGWHNKSPDPQFHDVLHEFLRALRGGDHPIHAKALAAFRKEAADRAVPRGDNALSLDHARTVYSFYRPLLPRPSPIDFDTWFVQGGLKAGIADLLRRHSAGGAAPAIRVDD